MTTSVGMLFFDWLVIHHTQPPMVLCSWTCRFWSGPSTEFHIIVGRSPKLLLVTPHLNTTTMIFILLYSIRCYILYIYIFIISISVICFSSFFIIIFHSKFHTSHRLVEAVKDAKRERLSFQDWLRTASAPKLSWWVFAVADIWGSFFF